MRATQQSNFAHGDHTNVKVLWHNSINTLRPSFTEYTMIVAHEFFDVLPVNVLQVIQAFPSLNEVCTNLPRKQVQTGVRFW